MDWGKMDYIFEQNADAKAFLSKTKKIKII